MRIGGVLQAVTEVLAIAGTGRQPVSEILKNWAAGHRFAGAKDRALIGNIVYDALRKRASLCYKMASDEPHALAYASLLAQGGYNMASLEQALANDKFAPPPLSLAQQRAWGETDIKAAPDFVQADIPQWCIASFEKSFGAVWPAEAKALAERPPLDLRVNGLKAGRQKVQNQLRPFGAAPVALTPWALRIAATEGAGRHPNVQAEPAFQKGWFEVQDCGSQMAARLCAAKPGEQALDYCAGGGGKTLALAADMENRGQIHAYDVEKSRLAPIFVRLRRAGARNAQVHAEAAALAPLAGSMDCVLLDAPCSGTGTWRRHPDIKWRLTAEKLAPRLEQQRKVLAAGADFVRPGGRLVYVTCSLFHEENDAQIARFLSEDSRFKPADMRAAWDKALAFADVDTGKVGELAPKTGLPHFTPSGLALSPRQTATDGFFISILERLA